MTARIMCRGGVIGFCETDPSIPMGTVVSILGHYFWIHAGEVERSKSSLEVDCIVYQAEDMGELRDVRVIEVKR